MPFFMCPMLPEPCGSSHVQVLSLVKVEMLCYDGKEMRVFEAKTYRIKDNGKGIIAVTNTPKSTESKRGEEQLQKDQNTRLLA
jgi:hypothetical protein